MAIAGDAIAQPSNTDVLGLMGGGQPAGLDQARGFVEETIGQIRELDQLATALASSNPAMASDVDQIRSVIRRMIVKAGQSAPSQTASSEALPMGG